MKKLFAEFFGTFWLVFGGCGSAIFASHIAPAENGQIGILLLGVALAFGLTVLTMAYAVGHISGGHFNPAVSFGLLAGGRFSAKDLIPYILAQCIGGIVAAAALYTINGGTGGNAAGAFASNFYDSAVYFGKSYSLGQAFLAEFLLTMFFLIIIMGATDKFAKGKFAGIAIGLGLTLIHLISIPITNTSVNPARSLSQALFVGGQATAQVWLFWVAPILGGILGGLIYKFLLQKKEE
ncbi:MIP family channel protein [Pseudopedobacter saltans DSM 12145]|uniref:MIP family channel protein n=1 Tax=Pseudopedobacter saltans (strain ATCC 51119 / DSM 12145 / JCM 21818 / CCUG 39354 / LMG 10337 / NBRC 100064 / NCIMB 13643) TaxID=762903 RepID=F0S671_PSESL|nr:aquaporin Z [Pseudopedobacter saltans]ADY53185.1 MIP family channel protein [Pseudopedobacter saltans DSM 12145]